MKTESVKHWFLSLGNGAKTANAFKGKARLSEGLQNILVSHLLLAGLMTSLIASALMSNVELTPIQLLWPIAFLAIGVASWLTRSYMYHLFASMLGGKADYQEYAGLTSFPMSGAFVTGTFVLPALMFFAIEWVTGAYVIMLLIPLASIVSITQREYGISTGRALTAVILPTALMFLLSLVLWLPAFNW